MDDTEMLVLVHQIVATNNGYIDQLNRLLAEEDAVIFAIPAVAVQGLMSILEVNVELIKHFAEGQAQFREQLAAIVEKHKENESN